MDSVINLFGDLVNSESNTPKNFYQVKNLISQSGLSYDRIHYNINGCMFFYRTDSELKNYKFYGYAHYKRTPIGKMVLINAMTYLPLIPILKWLYT